jgi:hypothetical protein
MKARKIAKAHSWSTLGNKCKHFEWYCCVCEAYRYKELFGGFASLEIVDAWAEPLRQEEE